MKIKYWTVTVSAVGGKTIITAEGQPFTNKREAVKAKSQMHSSNAVVVAADDQGNPTTSIVG